jgi:hypothetical protein
MAKNIVLDNTNIFIELNKLNDELIREMSPELVKLLPNKMYNYSYLYTLSRYKDLLKSAVVTKLLTTVKENKIINLDEMIDKYLIYKIKKEYMPNVKYRCDEIASIPMAEQKSPEWYKQREELISASDAGYFLKTCGQYKSIDTLKIKLGIKFYPNSTAKPLVHGNTYEDVTRAIYESRHGVAVTEYGLLSAGTTCVGASPDGIITDIKLPTLDAISRYGRLLEIKNPYSRVIDSKIKSEYMVQILQQQFTTQLPVCDFVETTIVDIHCNTGNMNYKPYITLDDMLNDTINFSNMELLNRIKNPNIPKQNVNKFGNEKGLVLCLSKKYSETDIRNKYLLYPIDIQYDKLNIEKWLVDKVSEYSKDGWYKTGIRYWRLDVYSEKTVIYDQKVYEKEYIPKLESVWDVVKKCRLMKVEGKTKEEIECYIDDLQNQKDNYFYNLEAKNKKFKKTKQIDSDHSDYSNGESESEPEKVIYDI